ncbi:FAD-binding oxidoreductase [Tritonibacter mobilis]|uniref:FAD-binding oxidoreductase n=1 Tax=Tritonibacter mobilis TaxID=379347 RepID=UPI000806DD2E|nr:FAD-binding oxidoreductase [Tritonibacter mobilis]NKX29996.1 FAD-binding oxidoreductase [Rhodobacteraceae bacterium R_SAG6]
MNGLTTAFRDLINAPKGILTDPQEQISYATGARHDQGRAALVLRPETTAEVSAVLVCAAAQNITVIPQSGNTGLVSGSTPDDSGEQIILSLDRMNTVFDLNLRNRSVRVGAGMRLSELNARLEPHGLFFPVDLSADPMIGGMIATNTGGSRFLRYGDVRGNALSLTVVLADENGTTLTCGSDLRKNNAGVDWKHVFIGTSGAFGVVTEAVLNLEPLPRHAATALLIPTSPEHTSDILARLERMLGARLSAFEGISGAAARHALDHSPSLRNPFVGGVVPDFMIMVEASQSWDLRDGEPSLDDTLESCLAEIFEEDAALLMDALMGRPEEIWALRHALSEGVKAAGHLYAFDLSFDRGVLCDFLAFMRRDLPQHYPDLEICDFGHFGDGGVHFNLVRPAGPGDATYEAALRQHVSDICVRQFGGSFSAEHGIGRKTQTSYDRYTPDQIKQLADGLKSITSPAPLGAARFGTQS